jgi:AAA domain
MRLIFIYGLPATGKLTVAQELATGTGYKLFHNHLVVDLLLGLFEFGSEPFVELREEIWLSVFEQAGRNGIGGLIFTFAPEKTVRPEFVGQAVEVVERGGGRVDFVELTCPVDELKRRMGSASRLEFQKLSSVELFEQLLADGVLDSSEMPKAAVAVDTSECGPAEAAARIAEALGLPAVK